MRGGGDGLGAERWSWLGLGQGRGGAQGGGRWSGATVGRVVREERKRANIVFKGY